MQLAQAEGARPDLRFHSPDPEATRSAARALVGVIDAPGLVVALLGPLGAGKTLFVKGLGEGFGLPPARISSPTFGIVHQYPCPTGRLLAHVDLYRVASLDELDATGFLDLLEPGSVVAVEWADRLPDALPLDHLAVRLRRGRDPSARSCEGSAGGEHSARTLSRWRDALRAAAVVTLESE